MRVDPTDDDLLGPARNGGHRAFALLLRRHDAAMRRLANRLVGSSSMDDVLQDAYLKAYLGLGRFRGDASFRTWLYTIVYRTSMDHLRLAGRRREDQLDEARLGPAADVMADQIAGRSVLRQALDDLSADHAAVVFLVLGEGMTYDETGDALGLAPGTVASRLSRARKQLQTALNTSAGSDSKGDRP